MEKVQSTQIPLNAHPNGFSWADIKLPPEITAHNINAYLDKIDGALSLVLEAPDIQQAVVLPLNAANLSTDPEDIEIFDMGDRLRVQIKHYKKRDIPIQWEVKTSSRSILHKLVDLYPEIDTNSTVGDFLNLLTEEEEDLNQEVDDTREAHAGHDCDDHSHEHQKGGPLDEQEKELDAMSQLSPEEIDQALQAGITCQEYLQNKIECLERDVY